MNTEALKPLGSRVVIDVEKQQAETKSPGGIIIPGTVNPNIKAYRGTVVATGPGKLLESGEREPMEIAVDDIVWFAAYAGQDIKPLEGNLMVVHQLDVLGIEQ